MSADLAVQKAIRLQLTANSAVTDLVPADNILDRNARPAPDPSVIIGEGQTLPGNDLARRSLLVTVDLHVWKKEPGLAGAKGIAWAVRAALHASRLDLDTGFHCADCTVSSMRFLRDADGETSHGVVTVDTIVSEA